MKGKERNTEADMDYIMPFGKHKGRAVGDIEISYLLWLLEEQAARGELMALLLAYEDEMYEARETNFDDPAPTLREILL